MSKIKSEQWLSKILSHNEAMRRIIRSIFFNTFFESQHDENFYLYWVPTFRTNGQYCFVHQLYVFRSFKLQVYEHREYNCKTVNRLHFALPKGHGCIVQQSYHFIVVIFQGFLNAIFRSTMHTRLFTIVMQSTPIVEKSTRINRSHRNVYLFTWPSKYKSPLFFKLTEKPKNQKKISNSIRPNTTKMMLEKYFKNSFTLKTISSKLSFT